jgi:hypothetical protein
MGMPRIPPKILDCVCYLYENEADARAGRKFGGTAFLASVPTTILKDQIHIYAVTNWHVACHDNASVLRINAKDRGTDILAFGPEQWEFDPVSGHDVAVVGLDMLRPDSHKISSIPLRMFMDPQKASATGLGAGEDVFIAGRFVDHDGGEVNLPASRFGNISVTPTPIKQPSGRFAYCYCTDLHSRSGYSGLPVFVYRTSGSDLEEKFPHDDPWSGLLLKGQSYLGLLGIHFAQFPEIWELRSSTELIREAATSEPLITDGKYVKGLSEMTCVLPAWEIAGLLNAPKLREQRLREEQEEVQGMMRDGMPPEAEAAHSQLTEEPEAESVRRPADDPDWRDPDEAAQLRDEMLRRTLNMPPMPRKRGSVEG